MVSYFLNKYFSLGFKKVLNDYIYYPQDIRARFLLKNTMPFIISFILGYITNSSYVLLSCFLFSFVIAFFQEKYLQKEIDKIEKQTNDLKAKKRASNLYIKTRNF